MRTLLLFVLLSTSLSAQTVTSFEEQTPISAVQLSSIAGISITYNVRNYKVLYTTTDAFGQPHTASGLVCVPNDVSFIFPFGVYNHGTVDNREAVPSREGIQERLLPQLMAGQGILTVAPDYLGLGDSEGIHPYVHAATEVSAGKDMLIAVRDWLPTIDYIPGEQLFITGYSQGGHAAAALHREMSTNPVDGFEVEAATHLSGPYSISEVMLGTLFEEELTTLPGYIAYTYISYNYVYGLYDDLGEAFVEPYLAPIRRFADQEISLGEFNLELTNLLVTNEVRLDAIFQDSVRQVLEDRDTSSTIIQALIDNDTYDWAPPETTLIYYCTEDEQVPNRNAILADSVMRANGAAIVALQSGGPLSHFDCVDPAFGLTLGVFTALADIFPLSLGEVASREDIRLHPNPVAAGTLLRLAGAGTNDRPFVLYDLSGREMLRGQTSASGELRLPASLPRGVTVVRVGLADGSSVVRRVVVK